MSLHATVSTNPNFDAIAARAFSAAHTAYMRDRNRAAHTRVTETLLVAQKRLWRFRDYISLRIFCINEMGEGVEAIVDFNRDISTSEARAFAAQLQIGSEYRMRGYHFRDRDKNAFRCKAIRHIPGSETMIKP